MKSQIIYFLLGATLITSGCNKMSFAPSSASDKATKLIDPTPTPVDCLDGCPLPTPVPTTTTIAPTPTTVPAPTTTTTIAPTPTTVAPAPTTTIAPVPTPLPNPALKSGDCVGGEQLLSCMTCDVPSIPQPPPVLSTKAQKLAEIMSKSCPIHNKSEPAGYQPPSRDEVFKRLEGCTAQVYRDVSL
jgi:hypothetical protein